MDARLKEKINAELEKQGKNPIIDDDDLKEFLLYDAKKVRKTTADSHRWYDDIDIIVAIGDLFVEYAWYHTTGDSSADDMDLEFDFSSIIEVEPFEKTVTDYRAKIDKVEPKKQGDTK